MREILLATGNPGKAEEMRQILSGPASQGLAVRWRMLSEFPGLPEAEETGSTFAANAELKAFHYARLTGLWTLADDSGLEVDALHGAPGVRSARFAGEPKSDARNNALLVEQLAGVPADKRTARFRCVVVLADADRVLASAEGAVEGLITEQPRGSNGFGYDPHFLYEAWGMTAAEMPSERKHTISHRGQALGRLREKLVRLLSADKESTDVAG